MKRIVLTSIFAMSMLGLGFQGVSLAQTTSSTSEDVVAVCAIDDNYDACLSSVGDYVGQVTASDAALDAKQLDLNTLVASLAALYNEEECPSDYNSQIADAIDQVGVLAAEIIEPDAVAAIAEGVRTCAVGDPTAALPDPASAA